VISRLFRKVEQGKALIVSKMRKVDVTFTGQVVLPVLHKAEVMDISVKTIDISRTGRDGLICRDNIRADIRISLHGAPASTPSGAAWSPTRMRAPRTVTLRCAPSSTGSTSGCATHCTRLSSRRAGGGSSPPERTRIPRLRSLPSWRTA
jgi:hypothetical protein